MRPGGAAAAAAPGGARRARGAVAPRAVGRPRHGIGVMRSPALMRFSWMCLQSSGVGKNDERTPCAPECTTGMCNYAWLVLGCAKCGAHGCKVLTGVKGAQGPLCTYTPYCLST